MITNSIIIIELVKVIISYQTGEVLMLLHHEHSISTN